MFAVPSFTSNMKLVNLYSRETRKQLGGGYG